MALPSEFKQELKARNNIVDFIGSYVRLKRAGSGYTGLCPFHNEKTPSFHVYTNTESFYCFGCHVGGDVITFAEKIENLDYYEAVKLLADRAGLQVPEDNYDNSLGDLKNRIREINREAGRFYYSCLVSEDGRDALRYLLGRGLTIQTIRKFGLGYSPKTKFALCNHLQKLGYKKDELVAANVAFVSRSGALIDRFINRVMFPIFDLRGNVIGFGGRIMTDEKPKYLNTNDTPVFSKRNNIFALNIAKNTKEDYLILCEGYMDVIALHQAGFTNAIATLGTALTEEQVNILSKYTNEIVVCYDSDKAGRDGTERSISILRKTNLKIRILNIPEGKDPDEFIRSHGADGAARFKQLIANCGNDIEYKLSDLRQKYDISTPNGKISYAEEASKLLASVDSGIERDVFISKLSEETGVSKDAIKLSVIEARKKYAGSRRKQMTRDFNNHASGVGDRVNPEKHVNLGSVNSEECIIAYLLREPNVKMVDMLSENLSPDSFAAKFTGTIYGKIIEIIKKEGQCDLTDLAEELGGEETSYISGILARLSDVQLTDEDCKRHMNIIKTEEKGRKAHNREDGSDLQAYLDNLRRQKK